MFSKIGTAPSNILARRYINPNLKISRGLIPGAPGSGAGKGGGGGGSVRGGGGGLGQYGAAQEEGYFHNKTREELKRLKERMKKTGDDKKPPETAARPEE